MHFYAARIVQI